LVKDGEKDQQLLATLQDKMAKPTQAQSNPLSIPPIKITFPKEHRLRWYAGNPSPTEWVSDAKCSLTTQAELSSKEKVHFLISHLDSSARVEIQCRESSITTGYWLLVWLRVDGISGPCTNPLRSLCDHVYDLRPHVVLVVEDVAEGSCGVKSSRVFQCRTVQDDVFNSFFFLFTQQAGWIVCQVKAM